MNAQAMPQTNALNPRPAPGIRHRARARWRSRTGATASGRRTNSRRPGRSRLSPAAHVLHYASTCFEGFKAYRWADGSINIFRMDRHIARMRQSARLLGMPEPDAAQLAAMVTAVVDRVRAEVPEAAGRAVPAPDADRHERRRRRRDVAPDRGHADRAREPGVGLLRHRPEAAAHLRRGAGDAHRLADGHGQDRRQLCRGARAR